MGLGVFDHREDLVGVLQYPVLDVHAAALGVLLFAADRLGVAEVVGEGALVVLEVGVVEQVGGLGGAHEQPGLATEGPAVRLPFGGFEHAAQVGAHRRDAGAGGQHDHVGVLVVGQEHLLAHRPSDFHLGAGFDVAEVGGAHAVDGLAVLLVLQLAHAQRHGVACHVVAMAGAGNRVEAQLVGLAVGVAALGDDADALALHILQLGLAAGQVEGDVVHPADGAFPHQAVVLGHGADEGILRLVGVDGDSGVGHGGFGGGLGCGWLFGRRSRSGGFRRGRLAGGSIRGGGCCAAEGVHGRHRRNSTTLLGDRLHRLLQLAERHREATLGLALLAKAETLHHH